MYCAEDQKIKMAEAGLIELPYTPLPEPVTFVTSRYELRITIVSQKVQIVQGRRFKTPGISAWFKNGSFSTRDPRIVKYLRWSADVAAARGGKTLFTELPGKASLESARAARDRLAKVTDKIAAEVEKELGPIPKKVRDKHIEDALRKDAKREKIKKAPRVVGGMNVVDTASTAHERVFHQAMENLFDTSIFEEANKLEPMDEGDELIDKIMEEAKVEEAVPDEAVVEDNEPNIDDDLTGKVDKLDLGVETVDPSKLIDEEEADESSGGAV